MLARYKKQGGMDALLALLETCGTKKREALMKTVEAEDAQFAAQVKAKLLTIDRLLTWDPLVLAEAVPSIPESTLAFVCKGYPKAFEVFSFCLKDIKKRALQVTMEGMTPKPEEIEISCIKVIEKVRECIKTGVIKVDDQGNPTGGAKKVA